jgi:hypothetical protein
LIGRKKTVNKSDLKFSIDLRPQVPQLAEVQTRKAEELCVNNRYLKAI